MLMVLTLINTLQANTFPKSDRIKELFDGHFIPQAKDWEELRELVKKDGLYHQNRFGCCTKWLNLLY